MKLFVSTTGIKRVAVSIAGAAEGEFLKKMKGKHSVARRLTHRAAALPAVLLLGFLLLFLFVRTAFLVLESAALCSSSIGCLTWRFLGGSDAALSLNSGYTLWHPGALPPALVAFEGHVHHIDASWHVAGMGHRYPEVDRRKLEAAAVIHFSGPAKPWLEIGSPEREREDNISNLTIEFTYFGLKVDVSFETEGSSQILSVCEDH
ncbi:putative galacturonosyltransferase 15 [Sesamum angolense]|uniref:Hexosyltransferase n=1 Tax=Sesamum angolense TaxID=2727404 RepID=A0AAE2BR50_9LAMI|nr:putative galacturonosyltransferase 15 [Sesamum angolense]